MPAKPAAVRAAKTCQPQWKATTSMARSTTAGNASRFWPGSSAFHSDRKPQACASCRRRLRRAPTHARMVVA
eukprot:6810595-Lingulodinium_polyedra.AAC.1